VLVNKEREFGLWCLRRRGRSKESEVASTRRFSQCYFWLRFFVSSQKEKKKKKKKSLGSKSGSAGWGAVRRVRNWRSKLLAPKRWKKSSKSPKKQLPKVCEKKDKQRSRNRTS
jgi:hypothetical protein